MSLKRLHSIDTNQPEWATLIKGMLDRLIAVRSDIRVFIFGSFVRGKMTADSDLDIAVILPDEVSQKQFLEDVYKSGPVSKWPLDLVVLQHSRFERMKDVGGVSFDISKQGIELYPNWNLK